MFKKLIDSFKKITNIEEKVEVPIESQEHELEISEGVTVEIQSPINIEEDIDIIEDVIEEPTEEELKYIKQIKIMREKGITAISLYTHEEQKFESYDKCSKALKVPKKYIIENLNSESTDYFGEAIEYLAKELGIKEYEKGYINNSKSPIEIFNELNNMIFNSNLSEEKIDEILNNSKIHPIKMHYRFECGDCEYESYFKTYKSIIKRGGKKKVELINTKNEVIDVFKSVDECAKHFKKEKNDIVQMLKLGNNKIGRYEIRYSLRNI